MISAGIEAHGRAIAKSAGTFFNPECDHVISRHENGKLLGGVIFTGFTGSSIGIHAAGFVPHWVNRDLLWITFHYPFEQLKVKKLIGQIPSGNRKALDFNENLGFKEEARIADVFPDEDLVVMSMRREDCRWLNRGSRGK
jgi:RimJ/RimL family protein N-acetyltransferase